MSEQAPLIPDLPVYADDLARIKEKKKKDFQNMLPEQLNRLLTHFRLEPSDVYKATEISPSTISGWTSATVDSQMLDNNIKKVARYLGVTIDYLAFATPMTERDFEIERAMEDEEDNDISA